MQKRDFLITLALIAVLISLLANDERRTIPAPLTNETVYVGGVPLYASKDEARASFLVRGKGHISDDRFSLTWRGRGTPDTITAFFPLEDAAASCITGHTLRRGETGRTLREGYPLVSLTDEFGEPDKTGDIGWPNKPPVGQVYFYAKNKLYVNVIDERISKFELRDLEDYRELDKRLKRERREVKLWRHRNPD